MLSDEFMFLFLSNNINSTLNDTVHLTSQFSQKWSTAQKAVRKKNRIK